MRVGQGAGRDLESGAHVRVRPIADIGDVANKPGIATVAPAAKAASACGTAGYAMAFDVRPLTVVVNASSGTSNV